MDEQNGGKVYSPDIQTYSFEGSSGIFGTIASFVVGPVRFVMRVTHNICILPANLLYSYAGGLLLVGGIAAAIGVFDFVMFRKWPLLVSQIPVIILAYWLRKTSSQAVQRSEEKTDVEIDTKQIEDLCSGIYDEINREMGKDAKQDE